MNYFNTTIQNIKKNITNTIGFRTNRRIIIFDSDDWGSLRMPSLKILQKLEKEGLGMSSIYNQFDTIEAPEDLEGLFTVLNSVHDKNGRPAVFTANSVTANPDFSKIKESNFREYFYEPSLETLKRYHRENSIPLIHEGIKNRIFIPQFHGREHINVRMWLRALSQKDPKTIIAFNYGVYDYDDNTKHGFLAAFDLLTPEDLIYQATVITEGLSLFKNFYGYNAEYFVPPNGPFNNKLNKTLFSNGIKLRSASKIQIEPLGNSRTRKVIHWLGQKDKTGILYITRNCFFEPSQPGQDWVDSCLYDIKTAFMWHKPAIISSHRVNYIGALRPENRNRGLKQLKQLLNEILKNWPDVEFLSTPELRAIIVNK